MSEADFEWIPRIVRDRLDRCAVRISLTQWQAMDLATRAGLTELAAGDIDEPGYLGALQAALTAADAGSTRPA